MTIALTNTLGGRKETFEPMELGKVSMYHCGPTVKESINIGKFRSYVFADLLRRYLEYSGYEVFQVMNITDVGHLNEFEEDTVEVAAGRTGMTAVELAEKEEAVFHEDRRALHIRDAHKYPRAREHIGDMIRLVEDLEHKGVTYRAGGNIYFDIEKAPRRGSLGAVIDDPASPRQVGGPPHPEKRHALDIDLWRTDALHQLHWPSPWGLGFPGWHTECVAMSLKYLGGSFDIHTGTIENIFPHHECEIAQAETLSGKPLARWWLHTGPVLVDGKPMTRENQNVLTVHKLLEAGFRGSVIRVALLSGPYRQPLQFGEEAMAAARGKVNLFLAFREHLETLVPPAGSAVTEVEADCTPESCAAWIQATESRFRAALDDDLGYGAALDAVVAGLQTLGPTTIGDPSQALEALRRWDMVLGIVG